MPATSTITRYSLIIICVTHTVAITSTTPTSVKESPWPDDVTDSKQESEIMESTTTIFHDTVSVVLSTTDFITLDPFQHTPDNESSAGENYAFMTSLLEYKIYKFFLKEFTYIASALGFITNPLTIFVSLQLKPFGTSELYMLVLGVTDLIVGTLRIAMRLIEMYTFVWNNALCKMLSYFGDYSYMYSNWVVVCWSLERLIAVMFPMKLSVWCTVRRVRIVLFSVFIACGCVGIPILTERYIVRFGERSFCDASPIFYTIYKQMITCFYIYIPVILVFVCNALIVKKIRQMTQSRSALTTNPATLEKRLHDQRQVTRLLLVVAYTFVFLHVPQIMAIIWETLYPDPIVIYHNSIRDYMRFNMFLVIGYQITDIQNGINFFLYCMFGSKVRKALCDLFGCCRRKQPPSMSSTMVTDMSVSTTAHKNSAFNEQ